MDTEAQDLHLMKLNELVQDEDKIVTFTSIASDFNLDIDESKSLLSNYVSDQRHLKPEELAITYIISGILKNGHKIAVVLIKETDLKHERDKFETVYSEIIYSIQKSKNLDFNLIASVNKLDQVEEKIVPGSVIGENCFKRKIKVKTVEESQPTIKEEKAVFNSKKLSSEDPVLSQEKPCTSKISSQSKQTKAKPSGKIASFFSKSIPKVKETKEVETNKVNTDKVEVQIQKNGSSENDAKEIKEISVVKNKTVDEEKMEVDEVESPTKKQRSQEKTADKKRKKVNKNNKEQPSKKRKRIQVMSDSDSDDIFGTENEENKDIVEKSEDEDSPVFIKAPLAPKNKIRKAIDVTYEDEEGFIVTKTEYVFEDPPEEEINNKPVVSENNLKPKFPTTVKSNETKEVENGTKSKGKKAAKKPVSGKQPTLMSFFKKA